MPDGVIRFRDNRNALVEMPVRECADMPAASHALTEALGVPVAITPGRVDTLQRRPITAGGWPVGTSPQRPGAGRRAR